MKDISYTIFALGDTMSERKENNDEEMPDLSVIIPVYNEEENVRPLYENLQKQLKVTGQTYEIIFVDDGSTDTTFKKLSELESAGSLCRIIKFRKNFGKSPALNTAFRYAKGSIIITMDGDLQDDPKEIPVFLSRIDAGFDLVCGWKYSRMDPLTKTVPSWIFNKLTSFITDVNIHDFNCGFKAYRRAVVKNLNLYGEMHRYIPALVAQNGYRITEIKVHHYPRVSGKSKYGFSRLIKGLLDLITVKFITDYSSRPLHMFGIPGLISLFIGFVLGIYLVLLKFLENIALSERPLLMLSVLLILTGFQFISMGLLGEMLTFRDMKEQNFEKYIETVVG
jgi:glycosyltransferase involved in cell wall biosynthesis